MTVAGMRSLPVAGGDSRALWDLGAAGGESGGGPVAHPVAHPVKTCMLCGQSGAVYYEGLRDQRCGTPAVWNLRRCADCGLLWVDPRPAGEALAGLYANYYTHGQGAAPRGLARWRERGRLALLSASEGYEALAERAWQRPIGRAARAVGVLDEMARLGLMGLDGRRKGRLLDVGCGSGRLLALFGRAGWKVAGVEPDRRAAAVARERYGIEVYAGGLEQAPLRARGFDAIVLSHVLEHVEDPVALLTACRGLLLEGGRLALSTPNIDSRGHRRFGRRWLHLDVPRHLQLFSASSLGAVVERAGFCEFSQTSAAKSASSTWLSSCAAGGGRSLGAWALLRAVGFHVAEWRAVSRGDDCGEELFAWATAPGPQSRRADVERRQA
jgi:2-polyprenyl-3-methyl-5-hydroxy-6-metoxy-1,4-benzoquinol methylase